MRSPTADPAATARPGTVRCHRHRRRESVGRCVVCEERFCTECLMPTRVGSKCHACAGVSRSGTRRRPRLRLRLRLWPVAGVLAAVGLLAALAFLLTDGGGDPPVAAEGAGGGGQGVTTSPVRFEADDGQVVVGTLDVPLGTDGQPGPAAVIAPGFGPTSRDGIVSGNGTDTLYADVGAALASRGVLTLRYDKRGTGDSRPAEEPVTLQAHAADAAAALATLRSRDDVDPDRVVLVGHDLGGLVGLTLAAAGDGGPDALVLLSTPGRPLLEVLVGEIRDGGLGDSDAERAALVAELEGAVAAVLDGEEVPEVSPPLRGALPADEAPFLASVFAVEPAALAAEVRVPVMLVRGAEDPGIRAEDVAALRAALAAAPDVAVLTVEGAGHTLTRAESRGAGAAEGDSVHMHDQPVPAGRAHDAVADIADWVVVTLR